MFHLIWAILNIALFVFILYICIRLTRVINKRYGLLAAFIGVMLLMSAINKDRDSERNRKADNKYGRWEFNNKDSAEQNSVKFASVTIDRNWMNMQNLHFTYGTVQQGRQILPIDASTSEEGWGNSTEWQPHYILVSADSQRLHYQVLVTVKWQLLGIQVYSQVKSYNGSVLLR